MRCSLTLKWSNLMASRCRCCCLLLAVPLAGSAPLMLAHCPRAASAFAWADASIDSIDGDTNNDYADERSLR